MKYLLIVCLIALTLADSNFTWHDCGAKNATLHFDSYSSTSPIHEGEQ